MVFPTVGEGSEVDKVGRPTLMYKSLCRSVHLSHFCFFGILTPCPTSLRGVGVGVRGLTAPYKLYN